MVVSYLEHGQKLANMERLAQVGWKSQERTIQSAWLEEMDFEGNEKITA